MHGHSYPKLPMCSVCKQPMQKLLYKRILLSSSYFSWIYAHTVGKVCPCSSTVEVHAYIPVMKSYSSSTTLNSSICTSSTLMSCRSEWKSYLLCPYIWHTCHSSVAVYAEIHSKITEKSTIQLTDVGFTQARPKNITNFDFKSMRVT